MRAAYNVHTDKADSGTFDWRAYVVTDCQTPADIMHEFAEKDGLPLWRVLVRAAPLPQIEKD